VARSKSAAAVESSACGRGQRGRSDLDLRPSTAFSGCCFRLGSVLSTKLAACH